MANLSKIKREKMLDYLEKLKEINNDDENYNSNILKNGSYNSNILKNGSLLHFYSSKNGSF